VEDCCLFIKSRFVRSIADHLCPLPLLSQKISLPRSRSEHTPRFTTNSSITLTHVAMSLKRKAADAVTDATKKPKVNASITSFFGAPKPSPNAKTAAAAKFDREAWIAKLTEEQKDLLQLELDTLHESWLPHLKDVLLTPQFLELKKFLKQELKSGKTVYPPMADVYSWCVPTYAYISQPSC
jgi:hypothetical protein